MSDLDAALEMIKEADSIIGDPYAPYTVGSDHTKQETEIRCFGCFAVGYSKWPDWTIIIEHQKTCRWLAFRRLLDS